MRAHCAWAGLLVVLTGAAAAVPAPPQQPAHGPGGADYRHGEVKAAVHGKVPAEYWLFAPAAPVPKTAPVVVFLHGWGAMSPEPYRAWIDHIVRRGNIVIYPLYQIGFGTPVAQFTPNALAAVGNALEFLRSAASPVAPDLKRFAVVGHSMGGVLAANLAARAEARGLPRVSAFMSVQPGRTRMVGRRLAFQLEDLSQIPPSTLLLTVAADRDRIVRDGDARRIYLETSQVPPSNKNFVLVASDAYGYPPLEAHHFAPLARAGSVAPPLSQGRRISGERERMLERGAARGDRQPDPTRADSPDEDELPDVGLATVAVPDALDFFGYWKLFDGLTDAAFYGRNREYALGNTPKQRYMGAWSDGRQVKELVISGAP